MLSSIIRATARIVAVRHKLIHGTFEEHRVALAKIRIANEIGPEHRDSSHKKKSVSAGASF